MKFPEISKPETLDKKFVGKMTKKALTFIKTLLRMDPNERPSPLKALESPYFDEIREPNLL